MKFYLYPRSKDGSTLKNHLREIAATHTPASKSKDVYEYVSLLADMDEPLRISSNPIVENSAN